MAQSKYFPNLTNGVDIADVEQIEVAFSAVEEDMNAKISDITDGAVTTSKIADKAVTAEKLADGVIPTKTSDLENDSNYVNDADYVHTDNNLTDTEKSVLDRFTLVNESTLYVETTLVTSNINMTGDLRTAERVYSGYSGEGDYLDEKADKTYVDTQVSTAETAAMEYADSIKPTKVSDLENDEEYLKSADAVGKKGTGVGAEIFNMYESKPQEDVYANEAAGDYSHAEGFGAMATGDTSHAEGKDTHATGDFSHTEGYSTVASDTAAHAEGYGTKAEGDASHAEGMDTVATDQGAHAEGLGTTASGGRAHAEGYSTVASGVQAHAEGSTTEASAESSHAEGTGTTASSTDQHVQGRWNIDDKNNKYAHIVGNGHQYAADPAVFSNAHTLDWEGTGWFANKVKVGGTGQDDEQAKDVATEEYVDTKLAKKADAYTITTAIENDTLLLADKTETQLISAAVTTLTLTLPETIPADYECFFSFKSGATATSITAPNNIRWAGADCNASKQLVPMPNTVYEVGIRRIGTDADGNAVICARVGAC